MAPMSVAASLPGPRTPGLYNMLFFGLRPIEFARSHVQRFGLTWRMKGMPATVVFTARPEHARQVFSADPKTFQAFNPEPIVNLFGPNAVIMVSGTPHRRLRKLMMPPLHGARLRAYGDAMAEAAARHVGSLRRGDALPLRDLTTRFTMDVILRTVFGAAGVEESAELRSILESMVESVTPLTVFSPPVLRRSWYRPWQDYVASYARFDAWVKRALEARRRSTREGDDVFSLLLAARDEDGAPMSDAEVRDQLVTLLLAGHETTATALANIIQRLCVSPEVRARLRDELGPARRSVAELQSSAYLGAVIDETLRIDPIVTDVMRVVVEPFELEPGLVIPPGEHLSVIVEALHKLPSLYPEPERFLPERFLQRRYAPHEFVPFGGGVRRCLGAAFSDYETRIFLAEFVQRVDVVLARGHADPRVRRNIVMGPRDGVPVRVTRVEPAT
mgnify:CR=1 FL=1